MEDNQEKINFTDEDGKEVAFFVITETKIAGVNYLLVSDSEEEESEAYIMRELADESGQVTYEMVEDDHELLAISKVFEELLDDIDIEM